jgi:CRP-like cAMP-binding protein
MAIRVHRPAPFELLSLRHHGAGRDRLLCAATNSAYLFAGLGCFLRKADCRAGSRQKGAHVMDASIGRSLLRNVTMFRGLEDSALDEALGVATRRRIARGETIFCQGDPARAFYVLVSGRLKVAQVTPEGQQVVVRFIGPREMFGCVAIAGGETYPGTATAAADSHAIGWTQAATEALMREHPQMALNALDTVRSRLQEAHSRVRELSTERVEQRIAHALLRLAEQAGKPVARGVEIEFPLSRQDVAEMTGTTLHTVSRTLSQWEQAGLVESGRQRVTIRDCDALMDVAAEPPAGIS